MRKKLNIVLFAYNFPHRKTHDFIHEIIRLSQSRDNFYKLSLILAADFIKIRSTKSIFKKEQEALNCSPKELAEKYSIPFKVVAHNSLKSISLIKKHKINFGIISGARILKKEIIQKIRYGILNFHPGILPVIRGLDSMFWSIYKDVPIGFTAHLINEKIDSGHLVYQQELIFFGDENIEAINEKNYHLQINLIRITLLLVSRNTKLPLLKDGVYNKKMSKKMKLETIQTIHQYIKKHSHKIS